VIMLLPGGVMAGLVDAGRWLFGLLFRRGSPVV
jgi:hypothetical protein